MGEREFRRLINPIIAEKRNLDLTEASQKQYLQSNEVLPFIEKIGMDVENFGKTIVIPGTGLRKERLRTLLPYLPYEDFTPVLIRILANTRHNQVNKGKFVKYINPLEVRRYLLHIGELLTDTETKKAPN